MEGTAPALVAIEEHPPLVPAPACLAGHREKLRIEPATVASTASSRPAGNEPVVLSCETTGAWMGWPLLPSEEWRPVPPGEPGVLDSNPSPGGTLAPRYESLIESFP